MKITSKLFILLAILALVLVPVVGCTGSAGPAGPAGDPGPTRQIVVTWDFEGFPTSSGFGAVDVYVGQLVRIAGAGFNPGDVVTLSICEDNTVLDLWEFDYLDWLIVDIDDDVVVANDCGAFEVFTYIPDLYDSYWSPVPVTVRAWLNAVHGAAAPLVLSGDLQDTWPLSIWPFNEFLMQHPIVTGF